MSTWNRPDLETFEVGRLYRDEDSDELVEYLGLAFMNELSGEDVAVFRFVEGPGCLIVTKRDYDKGQLLRLVVQDIEDDLDEELG